MTSKILQRLIFYAPSMKIAIRQLELISGTRTMATVSSLNQNIQGRLPKDPFSKWSTDPRYPLPGNVAVDMDQLSASVRQTTASPPYIPLSSVILDIEDEAYRTLDVVKQFSDEQELNVDPELNCLEDKYYRNEINIEDEFVTDTPDNIHNVECIIQQCPRKLEKGFWSLFNDVPDDKKDNLTIITICQQTISDMTSWSEEVEKERDAIISMFVEEAKDICEQLQGAGFWADFIDPASGHAYLSGHSNHTLMETDDRYNHLGFRVEDLGCCKALSHKLWGTHVFVGTLFTNAPHDLSAFSKFKKRTSDE